ncbi:hypothetical protein [Maricaulis sp. CAU 1757]
MTEPGETPRSRLSQWAWFIGLIMASTAVVATVAYALRGLLFWAG